MKARCEHCNQITTVSEVGKWLLCSDHKNLKQYQPKQIKTYELKKTPLKQTTKPIPHISKKQSKKNSDYSVIAKRYKKENPLCEARINTICTVFTNDIHHKKGRTGELLTNESLFLPVCRSCHNFIEENPEFSYKNNFSIKRV